MTHSQKLKAQYGSDPESSLTAGVCLTIFGEMLDKFDAMEDALLSQARDITALKTQLANPSTTVTDMNSAVSQQQNTPSQQIGATNPTLSTPVGTPPTQNTSVPGAPTPNTTAPTNSTGGASGGQTGAQVSTAVDPTKMSGQERRALMFALA